MAGKKKTRQTPRPCGEWKQDEEWAAMVAKLKEVTRNVGNTFEPMTCPKGWPCAECGWSRYAHGVAEGVDGL